MLAPRSSRSLVSSSGHANTSRFFPGWRRPCWRLAPGKALFLRPVTPTRAVFSRADGALVGASLLAKSCFFIRSRQHGPFFPGLPVSLLASTSPQSLCPSSGHANRPPRIHSRGWRSWRLASGMLAPQGREPKNLHPDGNLRLTMSKSTLGWASRTDTCGESAACQPAAV